MIDSISGTMNNLYSSYLEAPESGRDQLLTEVHRLATRSFHDADDAQEFTIMTWQSLPDLGSLQFTFGVWIWRQIQWRRIDYVRARRRHELPLPHLTDGVGDPLSADEITDLMWHQSGWPALTERIGSLGRISDGFIFRVAQDLIAGYTQDEIALRLGCKPSTLRSRLSRYRQGHDPAGLCRVGT